MTQRRCCGWWLWLVVAWGCSQKPHADMAPRAEHEGDAAPNQAAVEPPRGGQPAVEAPAAPPPTMADAPRRVELPSREPPPAPTPVAHAPGEYPSTGLPAVEYALPHAAAPAPPSGGAASPSSADAAPYSADAPQPHRLRMAPMTTRADAFGGGYAPAPPAGGEPLAALPAETSAQPETAAPPLAESFPEPAATPPGSTPVESTPEENYHVVDVFYGTDRARVAVDAPDLADYVHHYRLALGVLALAMCGAGLVLLRGGRRPSLVVAATGLAVALAMGLAATRQAVQSRFAAEKNLVQYGDGRGELEMGLCRVSIPKDHRTGEVEAPSLLRLEFREDPEKHIVILEAKAFEPDEFFGRLRNQVAAASRRELLVFVHGYNVAFDAAVRRTAQIAYDLKFPGAAVCYSWPSHGGLLLYSADENNVEWTVPHLKRFLTRLREESGADAINLVAHSMGTRALTNALREFARESQEQGALFNQVVLAAPDIDAEVFRRDLAPALARTAERVTLYASSNDQALLASRKLHAYPRAGESGPNLVVLPGIDTIDVSAIDTSLLGHSYYGDNDSVISDLYRLVHESLPPHRRERLHPAQYAGLPYWIFLPPAAQAALPRWNEPSR